MNNKVLIIAEAGVNHNGNIDLAMKLIDVAADSGADYVKFQTYKTEKIVNKFAGKAEYQKRNMNEKGITQFSMLKTLEMPDEWHIILSKYAQKSGVKFLSTGFDIDSIDLLDRLGSPLFKIPSGEITNKPFIRHIARKNKPIILSTGMSTMDEIKAAIFVLIENGITLDMVTVLHCTTEYPAPLKEVNLKAMISIKEHLGVKVGYSDHTQGIEVPIAAVSLGAVVIEKHFTLDRNLPGPDHKASLEPPELKEMVKSIRNVELAISGDGIKRPTESELNNIFVARKSIVAACKIMTGDTFTSENIAAKRPGNGISPMLWDDVIGKTAKRTFEEDELIEL